MRRTRDKRSLVLLVMDTAAVAATAWVWQTQPGLVALAAAAWALSGAAFGLYGRRWWSEPRALALAVAKTWAGSSLALGVAALVALRVSPLPLLSAPLAGAAAGLAVRAAWRAAASRRRKSVVVVDTVGEERLAAWLAYYLPEWEVMGLLGSASVARHSARPGAMVACYLNGQASVPGDLRAVSLDELLERVSGRVLLDHADQVRHRRRVFTLALKRAADICVATLGLVVSAPLLALLGTLIKLESRGPAIYRQRRLGLDCRPFEMLKFRSMVERAEEDTGPIWASDNDPRCTRVGRVLRPLHLDELPQLVNVLRGEMTLVGPRPERPELADQLLAKIPAYRKRLSVKPGITGWAQVNQGYDREMDDILRKLEYDLFYVKHAGPLLDAAILLRTVDAVIFGHPRRSNHPPPP